MAIQQQNRTLASAPALLVYQDSAVAAGRGAILFYHGYTSHKEAQIKELRSLAEHGYVAVGIDNIGHGERRYSDFEERFNEQNFAASFLTAIQETAAEVPQIVDSLFEQKLADKVAIAGISMGGYITYAAILQEKRLRAAAPILGSPKWWGKHPQSPHLHLAQFPPIALLSQTGEKDESVPPHCAREFHQQLQPHYADTPERLEYVEYEGEGHFMSEQKWDMLWQRVLGWFDRYLQ